MFIMGVHLFLYHLSSEMYLTIPHLIGFGSSLPLMHGPLLFLYTGSVTKYFSKWKQKYLLHFIPTLVFTVIFFDFWVSPGQEQTLFLKNISKNPYNIYGLIQPAILISGIFYTLLTWLLYRRHRHNLLNSLSNLSKENNLHWLKNLLIGMLIIWLIVLLSNSVFEPLIHLTVSLYVVYIGFFGFRQGDIFTNIPDKYLDERLITDNKPRYKKSGLKDENAFEIKDQLEKMIIEKKLYLDENISLPKVAQMLNIHPNYLSQIINEKFQRNFYDFINSYRIEEFKRMISSGSHKNKTFFALALDCGFNSKASFNTSFKKLTGITPTQFAKSL